MCPLNSIGYPKIHFPIETSAHSAFINVLFKRFKRGPLSPLVPTIRTYKIIYVSVPIVITCTRKYFINKNVCIKNGFQTENKKNKIKRVCVYACICRINYMMCVIHFHFWHAETVVFVRTCGFRATEVNVRRCRFNRPVDLRETPAAAATATAAVVMRRHCHS